MTPPRNDHTTPTAHGLCGHKPDDDDLKSERDAADQAAHDEHQETVDLLRSLNARIEHLEHKLDTYAGSRAD